LRKGQHGRAIKTEDELLGMISPAQGPASPDFALGYAQALSDANLMDVAALDRLAVEAAHAYAAMPSRKASDGGTSTGNPRDLAHLLDSAAFELAALDVALSDMLSSLADHAKRGSLNGFKARYLRPLGEDTRPHDE
jgi:hypothetical protein